MMRFWDNEEGRRRRRLNVRRRHERESILLVDARRSAVRRWRASRVGALVILVAGAGGLAWALWTGVRGIGARQFWGNERFAIRTIEIKTGRRLTPEHVREYAQVAEGMNLFSVDIHRIRRDLLTVPVVASVEVRRRVPDTLVIHVTERIPVARLNEGTSGCPLAVDREGFLLGPSLVTANLPLISGLRLRGLRPGERVEDAQFQAALRALELCESPAFSPFVRVSSVGLGRPDYLDIRLNRGERVLISVDKIEDKISKLCEVLKHTADLGQAVAAIDMTVDRNFPVQYR